MCRLLISALILFAAIGSLRAQVREIGQIAPSSDDGRYLNVLVLEGQNGVNSVLTRTATSPVVEVRDSKLNLPVEGAEVTFQLPPAGPSGSFPGGTKTYKAVTNAQGQVRAPLDVGSVTGDYEIRVSATYESLAGVATIRQTNTNMPADVFSKKRASRWYKSRKFWLLTAGLAVGSYAGYYYGLRDDQSGSRIVITPGGTIVGNP